MLFNVLFALAATSLSVSAQGASNSTGTSTASAANSTTSALAGISPCVIQCVGNAATLDGCGSFTNVTCVCSSPQFQADATSCLTTNCSPSDLQDALQLQQSQCDAAGISPTGSATTTNSVPFTSVADNTTQTAGAPSGTTPPATSAGSATTGGPAAGTTPTAPSTAGSASNTSSGTPTPAQTGAASSLALKHGATIVGAVVACALLAL